MFFIVILTIDEYQPHSIFLPLRVAAIIDALEFEFVDGISLINLSFTQLLIQMHGGGV